MILTKTSNFPSYPGSQAEVSQLLELAIAYSEAAVNLFKEAERKKPLSYAPARLCSIHSIELFLNAFLRSNGISAEEVRSRMHNLADPTFVETLKLKKKTADHLVTMTEKREYLISRYAPELTNQHSELNRLTATLFEVTDKASRHLG